MVFASNADRNGACVDESGSLAVGNAGSNQFADLGVLATTEGSQITGLCAEHFDWAPRLDDPRFLLACERPTERPGMAAALESLLMLVGFADDTGRTGLVTIRDFLPHLLLA